MCIKACSLIGNDLSFKTDRGRDTSFLHHYFRVNNIPYKTMMANIAILVTDWLCLFE